MVPFPAGKPRPKPKMVAAKRLGEELERARSAGWAVREAAPPPLEARGGGAETGTPASPEASGERCWHAELAPKKPAPPAREAAGDAATATLTLEFRFPSNFPFSPPRVRCLPPVPRNHPCVDEVGCRIKRDSQRLRTVLRRKLERARDLEDPEATSREAGEVAPPGAELKVVVKTLDGKSIEVQFEKGWLEKKVGQNACEGGVLFPQATEPGILVSLH